MTRLIINQQRAEQKMAQAAQAALRTLSIPIVSLPKWGNINVGHESSPKR